MSTPDADPPGRPDRDRADPPSADPDDARLEEILRQGPRGAFALAALSTGLVLALYLLFYLLVYLPRGAVQ